jgi:hypothetical protein
MKRVPTNVKDIYYNVMLELKENTWSKYQEWRGDWRNKNTISFINEEDEHNYLCIVTDDPYCWGEEPYDYYYHQTDGIYYYGEKYGQLNYPDKDYVIRQFSCFQNIIQYGYKNYKGKYDISMYPIQVRNDYIKIYLKQLLSFNDRRNMRKDYFTLYPHKLKWFHNIQFKNVKDNGYPGHYSELFDSDKFIRTEYIQNTKQLLYKMLMNEKLCLVEKKLIQILNIDCWNCICNFVN